MWAHNNDMCCVHWLCRDVYLDEKTVMISEGCMNLFEYYTLDLQRCKIKCSGQGYAREGNIREGATPSL